MEDEGNGGTTKGFQKNFWPFGGKCLFLQSQIENG